MQHVTAVKIGGGQALYNEVVLYGLSLVVTYILVILNMLLFLLLIRPNTSMSHIQYLQFTTIQYNSTSFISNIEHNYITVIVEVVCLNIFFMSGLI